MENRNSNLSPAPYPWYDDRITVLCEEEEPAAPENLCSEQPSKEAYDTPKKIYEYLNRHVWKQDKAKKAASVIAYNCIERGVKSNAMFIGPTGSGKTHIWRCLKNIFPDRIEIVDGSNLTMDGWRGEKKWGSLIQSPIFRADKKTILVIDEADKMLSPKYSSSGENVSHSVQSEGLAMIEGTRMEVRENSVAYSIDTSRISFVFCGAFSRKAKDIAQKESETRIGFGAVRKEERAYGRPLTEADLLAFGVMPEFLGRIQRIVNLEPMTADDYYRITEDLNSFLTRIKKQYGANVRLTPKMRHELAETAYNSGLGIRGMENQIRAMLDEAIFEDCSRQCFQF